ncbi:MAG: hypothetical protein GXN97_03805 [Aquificae bacterium]|jgi:hypothetical protein|nr:hypothetical protein [Aquificota bacterium]
MHGVALVFMVTFWGLVLGLVVFVFCRLYCPGTDLNKTALVDDAKNLAEEPDEIT